MTSNGKRAAANDNLTTATVALEDMTDFDLGWNVERLLKEGFAILERDPARALRLAAEAEALQAYRMLKRQGLRGQPEAPGG